MFRPDLRANEPPSNLGAALGRTDAASEFDLYAASYSRLLQDPLRDRFAGDSAFFHLRKWMLIRDFLARHHLQPSTLTWLDVGCGPGELLKLAGANFRRAVGCDPSRKMVGSCTSLQVFEQPSPSGLPFPDQSFDLVTAACVYHHVHGIDRRALLTESIRRVLKPQGLFCLIEHNPWNPITRLIVRRCPIDRDAELLTPSFAARLVRSAGLEVIETAYFLYFPKNAFHFAGALEDRLRRLPLGGQFALFGRKPGPAPLG
jgi:SAM-dependent methyltransferase